VVVHGNNRNFCSALVTVDEEAIRSWAKQQGLKDDYAYLASSAEVKALMQGYFDELNKGLARFETVKHFAVLPTDFTVDGGELTPSLKVKRKVVETRYKAVLDGFYQGSIAEV
jgi:long-chain acyl-CoA synthetase